MERLIQLNYCNPNEETYRFDIFIENLLRITLHNSKQMQNYQMGVNQFTDLT